MPLSSPVQPGVDGSFSVTAQQAPTQAQPGSQPVGFASLPVECLPLGSAPKETAAEPALNRKTTFVAARRARASKPSERTIFVTMPNGVIATFVSEDAVADIARLSKLIQ